MIYFLQTIIKWVLRQIGLSCEGDIACSLCTCSVMSDSLRPLDCKPSGSAVHRISQARILERIAIPSSKGSSWPRDGPISSVSCRAGGFFFAKPWNRSFLESCHNIVIIHKAHLIESQTCHLLIVWPWTNHSLSDSQSPHSQRNSNHSAHLGPLLEPNIITTCKSIIKLQPFS